MNVIISSNTFLPSHGTRPPFIKIQEMDSETLEEKIFYSTEIDQFDLILFEECLKVSHKVEKDKLKKHKTNETNTVFRFKMSQNLHSLEFVENYDNLSNRKPFISKPGMGNMSLRTKYKLKLAKVYKCESMKGIKNKKIEISMLDDENIIEYKNSRSFYKKKSTNSFIKSLDQLSSQLDEEKLCENDRKTIENVVKKKTSFMPTHGISSLMENITSERDNMKEVFKTNDSIYNSYHEDKFNKTPFASRPGFVEELFKKYDYEDLDPWKKVQNRTKDKNLCLTLIKEVYNKICNVFN